MTRHNAAACTRLTRPPAPRFSIRQKVRKTPTGSHMSTPVLRIALDMPLRRLFDYLPPSAAVGPGQRVRVPFGRRSLVGLVVEQAAGSDLPADRLKPVLEVLDAE